MPLPELDPEQRRRALEKAAEVRRIRAAVKDLLRTGQSTFEEVLARADESDVLARMKVSEVLEAMPSIGKVRARRLMERLEIAPTRRLRGLGPRQREALLEVFRDGTRGGDTTR